MPPAGALVSEMEAPRHTVIGPIIGAGKASTANVDVAVQLEPSEYVMVATPADTPVIMPLAASAVAMDELPMAQVPPGIGLDRVALAPSHSEAGPEIVPGRAFTNTVAMLTQPEGRV